MFSNNSKPRALHLTTQRRKESLARSPPSKLCPLISAGFLPRSPITNGFFPTTRHEMRSRPRIIQCLFLTWFQGLRFSGRQSLVGSELLRAVFPHDILGDRRRYWVSCSRCAGQFDNLSLLIC
ncbi:hypothetical protein DL98DRAFT_1285 [Cadophora sp. DSE1049]|nr:hypothetical protein DL98DRAFT_1285 [Cadophora sp. DSE1049]